MRVTMKTLYAGADRSVAPGQTAEFPDAQARQLIARGYAVAADEDPATGDGRAKRNTAAKTAKTEAKKAAKTAEAEAKKASGA